MTKVRTRSLVRLSQSWMLGPLYPTTPLTQSLQPILGFPFMILPSALDTYILLTIISFHVTKLLEHPLICSLQQTVIVFTHFSYILTHHFLLCHTTSHQPHSVGSKYYKHNYSSV